MATPHHKYCESLGAEERMLITLRDELYGGSWDRMLQDLQERRRGRPYIFKLVKRIEDDLSRIEALRTYEQKHGVNLADYIKGDAK